VPSTHIGTSGWQHDSFAGRFYPDDIAQDDWLGYYAGTFGTVEVNNTFYQSPEPDTLCAWRQRTPDGFTFAIKANQYITHFKKLKDPEEPVQNLYRNVEPLGDALGPILFQCPPNWHQNLKRLHNFLAVLDDEHRHVDGLPNATGPGRTESPEQRGRPAAADDQGVRAGVGDVLVERLARLAGRGERFEGQVAVQVGRGLDRGPKFPLLALDERLGDTAGVERPGRPLEVDDRDDRYRCSVRLGDRHGVLGRRLARDRLQIGHDQLLEPDPCRGVGDCENRDVGRTRHAVDEVVEGACARLWSDDDEVDIRVGRVAQDLLPEGSLGGVYPAVDCRLCDQLLEVRQTRLLGRGRRCVRAQGEAGRLRIGHAQEVDGGAQPLRERDADLGVSRCDCLVPGQNEHPIVCH